MLGAETVSRRLLAETDVASAVYAEQIRSLFKQIPTALSVNFVNAALVAIVLTPLATRPLLLPWFVSVTLVTVGRGILWLRYRHARARPENAGRWSRLATWGALFGGLSWGIGGVILFPVIPEVVRLLDAKSVGTAVDVGGSNGALLCAVAAANPA
jgi:hypothetical protein